MRHSRPPEQHRFAPAKGDWADFALAVGIVSCSFMSLTMLGFGWYLMLFAS